MKTMNFKVAASLIVLAAVLAFGLSTAPAYAEATAGSALLFTYYDVRSVADGGLGLTDNYFTVINTSMSWVQAHIRIRTGDRSVELMDFDVLLSPEDVFTFDLYEAAQLATGESGGIEFASCDTNTLVASGFSVAASGASKGCVAMNSNTNTNLLSLIKDCQGLNNVDALKATLKGYVEVIGEGIVHPNSTNKNYCGMMPINTTNPVSIPKNTLFNLQKTSYCNASITHMDAVLHGKVLYATIAQGAAVRLATVNAEVLDNTLPVWSTTTNATLAAPTETVGTDTPDTRRIILHADTFDAELNRCDGTLAGYTTDSACMAYSAPSAKANPEGANDLNRCFYEDTASVSGVTTGTTNKFGAAKTFGPGIEDLVYRRDGTLTGAATLTTGVVHAGITTILNYLSNNFALVDSKQNMGNINPMAATIVANPSVKKFIETYYLNIPAPGNSIDIVTKIAIVFPFQHFIAETNTIKFVGIWNTTEYKSTATGSKFFSPGLPSADDPGDEAQLHTLTSAAFAEGWLRLQPGTAKNKTKTSACFPGSTTCTVAAGQINTLVCNNDDFMAKHAPLGSGTCGPSTYENPPGYTGLIFNIGGGILSGAELQYGDNSTYSAPGTVNTFTQSIATP